MNDKTQKERQHENNESCSTEILFIIISINHLPLYTVRLGTGSPTTPYLPPDIFWKQTQDVPRVDAGSILLCSRINGEDS